MGFIQYNSGNYFIHGQWMTSALGFRANWISRVYDTNPLFDSSKEVVPTQKWHFGAAHIYLHMYIYIVKLCIVYCIFIYIYIYVFYIHISTYYIRISAHIYIYIYTHVLLHIEPGSICSLRLGLQKKSNINHCTVNSRLVTVGGLKWRLLLVNEDILDLV